MALSPEGALSVETLDGSDPELPDDEPWQAACEILLEPDAEQSTDVILVGSSELSAPASPVPRRDLLAYEVRVNQRDIEDVCICCGSFQVHTQHPLFEGGMCAPCKDKFLDCLFLYDEDGYQSYCSVCCSGETLLICENPDCTRCYCFECVDTLVGPGTSGRMQALSNWVCFLCLPLPRSGLLQRRRKWRGQLKAFCDRESNSLETYKTVSVWKRAPVRVLSLFGDIRRELASLGFLESGSAPGQLRHLNDVTDVVRKDVSTADAPAVPESSEQTTPGAHIAFLALGGTQDGPEEVQGLGAYHGMQALVAGGLLLTAGTVLAPGHRLPHLNPRGVTVPTFLGQFYKVEAWGPFDLVYGATPPIGHARDHPPAWYLLQFHRILQYARPGPGSPRPFFWMFADDLVLNQDDQTAATRFLEADPVTIQDVCGQAVRDAVHVWSNIPAQARGPGFR